MLQPGDTVTNTCAKYQVLKDTSTHLQYKNGDIRGGQNSEYLMSKANFPTRSGLETTFQLSG